MAVKYKDYYATLGVQRSATEQEIKASYRKLARQFHPDTNPGDKSAEEKFKEIAEAYEVLKDPEKRKRYDMLGANWKAGADFNPPPDFGGFSFDFGGFGKSSPFSEFFEQIFGPPGASGQGTGRPFSQTRTNDPSKGLDQEAEIELTVEELARGAARNIQVTKPGQGSKNLQVKIPAGVRPGSKVRVPGEAATGTPGGKAGDLYLRVKVKPHPTFTLDGDNIVSELKISPALAVIGGEVSVETLDGQVHINVPALSQTGRMLRLRERGLPKLKQSVRGDHLVRLKVDIPKQISEEEKELYQRLLDLEKNKG